MTTTQVVLYLIIVVVAILYFRRMMLARGVVQYSPPQAAERLKEGSSVVLLDVRTAGERKASQIKGSVHIPLHELHRRKDELARYKNGEVICYCQSGNRSVAAAAMLKKAGFKVGNLKGGIAEWNLSGLR